MGRRKKDGKCLEDVKSTMPKTKRTALHLAARYGKYECISVLVSRGSNIEERDKDGQTPLALAAWQYHCRVVEELIRLGAKKNEIKLKLRSNIDQCLEGTVELRIYTKTLISCNFCNFSFCYFFFYLS